MDIRRLLDIILENSQELSVSSIDTEQKYRAVMNRMQEVFGHLDLGPGITLEMALGEVVWKQSYGIFKNDDGQCMAFLLMADKDLYASIEEYGNQLPKIQELLKDHQLRSIEGVALYINPQIRRSPLIRQIFRNLISDCLSRRIDFVYGKAHVDLQNMDFWGKHSVPIGSQIEEGKRINLFVLPMSEKAKRVF